MLLLNYTSKWNSSRLKSFFKTWKMLSVISMVGEGMIFFNLKAENIP